MSKLKSEKTYMKTVKHPKLPLIVSFDPLAHTYRDNGGCEYVSVTKFVSECFAPFDAEATAARVSARTGETTTTLLARWEEKRDTAAGDGTGIHAYAEALILGRAAPAAASDRERAAFRIVDRAVTMLARAYEWVAVEQVVFDPAYLVAGMIDLVARNRDTGALAIMDWKSNEKITGDSYGRRGLPPIAHLGDSKLVRYGLQLSTYATILTDAEYGVDVGEGIELALIHVPHEGTEPGWIPLALDQASVRAMLEARVDAKK